MQTSTTTPADIQMYNVTALSRPSHGRKTANSSKKKTASASKRASAITSTGGRHMGSSSTSAGTTSASLSTLCQAGMTSISSKHATPLGYKTSSLTSGGNGSRSMKSSSSTSAGHGTAATIGGSHRVSGASRISGLSVASGAGRTSNSHVGRGESFSSIHGTTPTTSTSALAGRPSIGSHVNSAQRRTATGTTRTVSKVDKLKSWNVSSDDITLYGDRCPAGFKKTGFLGRGGSAIIWRIENISPETTGIRAQKLVAKQFVRNNDYKAKSDLETCMREVEFGDKYFMDGVGRITEDDHPGINNLIHYLGCVQERKDYWLLFELGGTCLTKHLFQIKGEFCNSERVYSVRYQPFYLALRKNTTILKRFLREMCYAIDLLASTDSIHADLKPDNILVEFNPENEDLKVKLVDFGSAYTYGEPGIIGTATPEYVAPEILSVISQGPGGNKNSVEYLSEFSNPWSGDMWSLGVIFLEMIVGIPCWLSFKGKIPGRGRSLFRTGVFAVTGRDNVKIIQKQFSVLKNLHGTINDYGAFKYDSDGMGYDLLKRMLEADPRKRISPAEALEHPYLDIY
mmetsp:Transcript_64860/g.74553  ORF Transcript_64860/g.74553 Transcript_64860/m.74553 type:complete len:570 (+) Transcript_64860:9-1718(+)